MIPVRSFVLLSLIAAACSSEPADVTINTTTIVESTNPDQPDADTQDVVETDVPVADPDIVDSDENMGDSDAPDTATDPVVYPEWCTHDVYPHGLDSVETNINPVVRMLSMSSYIAAPVGFFVDFIVDAGPCNGRFVVEKVQMSVVENTDVMDVASSDSSQWMTASATMIVNGEPMMIDGLMTPFQATEKYPSRDYTAQSTLGWTFSSPTVNQGHVLTVLPVNAGARFSMNASPSSFDHAFSYSWEGSITATSYITVTVRELETGHVWEFWDSRPVFFNQ